MKQHRASILFSPTCIQLLMYLPIPIYDLNNIMAAFLFAVVWTDFIHCSAVSTVMELTVQNWHKATKRYLAKAVLIRYKTFCKIFFFCQIH